MLVLLLAIYNYAVTEYDSKVPIIIALLRVRISRFIKIIALVEN